MASIMFEIYNAEPVMRYTALPQQRNLVKRQYWALIVPD